jgi:hypothetical protein
MRHREIIKGFKMTELSDEELMAELGIEPGAPDATAHTPREERLLAGFEDISKFVDLHQRLPNNIEGNDIFERLYAVRLDAIRKQADVVELLKPVDRHHLLEETDEQPLEPMDDDALMAALEIEDTPTSNAARPYKEIHSAEQIATRKRCKDFAAFKPLFEKTVAELKNGSRATRRYEGETSIEKGNFFLVGGQMAFVAEVGEEIKAPNGESDARLRVIYSNGKESDLLRRSLQRALYKDAAGRRVISVPKNDGPLFAEYPKEEEKGAKKVSGNSAQFGSEMDEGDIESGTIYVLRSLSKEAFIAQHRNLIHKIGVTGGDVEKRIAQAETDPTYLLAPVEIVAEYRLANVNRVKLENLLHRFFQPAQIDLTIHDRFGNEVHPREWFLVPLAAIDEAVTRLQDGSLVNYVYDAKKAGLRQIEG